MRLQQRRNDFVGVHQHLRIECCLDAAHHTEFGVRLVDPQRLSLRLSDAVLGTDGPLVRLHEVENNGIERRRPGRKATVVIDGRGEIEVNIAVAAMAERKRAGARYQGPTDLPYDPK